MRTIETTASVSPDGTLTARVPPDIAPGEHEVVLVIAERAAGRKRRPPLRLPVHHWGPWPANLSLRREDLYDDWGR